MIDDKGHSMTLAQVCTWSTSLDNDLEASRASGAITLARGVMLVLIMFSVICLAQGSW